MNCSWYWHVTTIYYKETNRKPTSFQLFIINFSFTFLLSVFPCIAVFLRSATQWELSLYAINMNILYSFVTVNKTVTKDKKRIIRIGKMRAWIENTPQTSSRKHVCCLAKLWSLVASLIGSSYFVYYFFPQNPLTMH